MTFFKTPESCVRPLFGFWVFRELSEFEPVATVNLNKDDILYYITTDSKVVMENKNRMRWTKLCRR